MFRTKGGSLFEARAQIDRGNRMNDFCRVQQRLIEVYCCLISYDHGVVREFRSIEKLGRGKLNV